jgi:transcriptional regulator with XRE-family HTH domain
MPRRSSPDPLAVIIGSNIQTLRHKRRMTLAALADAVGTSKGHLSSVEHGLVRPRGRLLGAIQQALDAEVCRAPRGTSPALRLRLKQSQRRAATPEETPAEMRRRWRREKREVEPLLPHD